MFVPGQRLPRFCFPGLSGCHVDVEMPPVDYRRLGMIVLMYGAYSQVYRQVNGHARISTRKRSTVRSLPDRGHVCHVIFQLTVL